MPEESAPIKILENNIRAAIQHFIPVGGVVEVRAFNGRGREPAYVGYFDDVDTLIAKVKTIDGTMSGIYFIPDTINSSLLARCNNRLDKGIPATSDADVVHRTTFKIDLDPIRPSGISSTDAEKERAYQRMEDIIPFLAEIGFKEPFKGDSGNGYHLIYKVDLKATPENTDLIKRCLVALDKIFSDDMVRVDTSVFNAARIWKLYGTMVKKGDNLPDRPHRRCKILSLGDDAITPRDALVTLAGMYEPDDPQQQRKPGGKREIDLRDWIREYGVGLPRYTEKSKPGFRWFAVFDVCPFDASHTDRSAFIGQLNSGALVAACKHTSCGGGTNRWKDLRDRYEPPKAKRPKKNVPPVSTPVPREIGDDLFAELFHATIGEKLRTTDAGNAELFAGVMQDGMRFKDGSEILPAFYCSDNGEWYVWNRRYWELDKDNIIRTRYIDVIRHGMVVATTYGEDLRPHLYRHLMNSESDKGAKGALFFAQPLLAVRKKNMDSDKNLFNVQNGTLNLKTGKLQPFAPQDRLTRMSNFWFDATAQCPLWEKHIREILLRDHPQWIPTLQKALGSALLGTNPDQIMHIFWGTGENGKSTMLLTLRNLMGDYGTSLSPDTLGRARYAKSGADHRVDLLCLETARIATCMETEQGRPLDMGLIKRVTGGDYIQARGVREKYISEFVSGAIILYAVNLRPGIKDQSDGAWRRIVLWNTTTKVPIETKIEHYENVLMEERAGILNWLLEGLRLWESDGRKLVIPDDLKAFREDYQKDENPLQEWEEECVNTDVKEGWTAFKDLYESYRKHLSIKYPNEQEFKDNLISKKKFSQLLEEKYAPFREPGKGTRGFAGIVLKGVNLLKSVGVTDEVSHVRNSLTRARNITFTHVTDNLSHPSGCEGVSTPNPVRQKLAKIGIHFVPDITKYRRINGMKEGRCIGKPCQDAKMYEDENGENFLCEWHYNYIKKVMEDQK